MNFKSLSAIIDMAISRSTFMDKIEDLFPALVSHLCLIKYARLSKDSKLLSLIPHWKTEVKSVCLQIMGYKIKGSNSSDNIFRAIQQSFSRMELLSSDTKYYWSIAKFDSEGINLTKSTVDASLNEQVNIVLSMLPCIISEHNVSDLKDLIESM